MPLFEQIEFYRNSVILVPAINDPEDYETVLIAPVKKREKPRLFCSCSSGTTPKCSHARVLADIFTRYMEYTGGKTPLDHFHDHFLYSVFLPVIKQNIRSVEKAFVGDLFNTNRKEITVGNSKDEDPVIRYTVNDAERNRFLSRFHYKTFDTGKKVSRHQRMIQASRFVLTEIEKETESWGAKTSLVAQEESIWFRFAYHCYREYGEINLHVVPEIEDKTGLLKLTFYKSEKEGIFSVIIPRSAIVPVLEALHKNSTILYPFNHRAGKNELLFRFSVSGPDGQVTVIPLVNIGSADVSVGFHEINERFIYGDTAYLPDINAFCTFTYASMQILAKRWNVRKTLSSGTCAKLLADEQSMFSIAADGSQGAQPETMDLFTASGANDLGRIVNLPLIRKFDRVALVPESMNGNWCTISVSYRTGDATVSLAAILKTQKEKLRFLIAEDCIVDCESDAVATISTSLGKLVSGYVTMHRASLIQFVRDNSLSVSIDNKKTLLRNIRRLCSLAPEKSLMPVTGLRAKLRDYQNHGLEWLLFLYDYRLGGLLCDDMGLGKTIQILGLFTAVREQRAGKMPFLVVCPTTVISHWQRLAREFTPLLKVYCFYGKNRDLGDQVFTHDIILTSYGILRNEILRLCGIRFSIAVFDEAHSVKNQQTFSAQAAADIQADIKIGLTGTPIENSLSDLKSLFDIVLPGYLGDDDQFREQFLIPAESHQSMGAKKKLRIKTGPFILRRLKETVLTELPQKIQDIRSCTMSEDQRLLYRRYIDTQGKSLLATLRNGEEPVPYMHVFALLNVLRQICCHPVLVNKMPVSTYAGYSSGQWDLFCELLQESLDAGLKIVVFSNYLAMLKIMELHLLSLQVGLTTLTGSTPAAGRRKIIDEFNNNPDCKVFLGSLKAGGIGIDLTGGSVVIHYDRWWNAAREDQATDRVYRIGQTRGVQVFKLVTEKSIEEQMAQIIDFKKELADTSINVDSPDVSKIFSRDEIINILEYKYPD
jgi:superfamily II DNA or RNA helicase